MERTEAAPDIQHFDMRGFIENSLLEWDNHIAAVVVAGGCDLRCPYCHSWRYVTGLDSLERLNPQVVFDLLERQEGWIDGVVFTGGETTLQPGLMDFMAGVKLFGVETKLHTNGTRPDVVKALLEKKLVDCLALDYKAPHDNRFFAAAGIAGGSTNVELLEQVKQTFALAARSEIAREYHTTLDPQVIDPATLTEMAAALEPGGVWFLQQFKNGDCLDGSRRGALQYDDAQLDELEKIALSGWKGKLVMKRE